MSKSCFTLNGEALMLTSLHWTAACHLTASTMERLFQRMLHFVRVATNSCPLCHVHSKLPIYNCTLIYCMEYMRHGRARFCTATLQQGFISVWILLPWVSKIILSVTEKGRVVQCDGFGNNGSSEALLETGQLFQSLGETGPGCPSWQLLVHCPPLHHCLKRLLTDCLFVSFVFIYLFIFWINRKMGSNFILNCFT